MADAMTGPGYFYVAINESQLLHAFGTPTTAARIRNPGYCPAYSCRLGCEMSIQPYVQARHSGYPLDNTFKQK